MADAEFGALKTRPARRADSVTDPHLLVSVSIRLAEAHPQRPLFARAAVAGDDKLVQGIQPERGRVGPPRVRVNGNDERRSSPASPGTRTGHQG